MRGTTISKGTMNYFGSFSQQRTWAPLAQGADGRTRSVDISTLQLPDKVGAWAPTERLRPPKGMAGAESGESRGARKHAWAHSLARKK